MSAGVLGRCLREVREQPEQPAS
jgi:hypothetical protein